MNLSGISDKSILGRVLRFPLSLIPKNMAVPVLQGRLRGYRWIVGASIHGCWLGSYEYHKQKLFEESIASGSVVYDLGAQAGFYTLLASELVGQAGRVFAFEPLPRNIDFVKRHLSLNRVSNVTLFEAAVSERGGTAFFKQEASSLMGHLAETGGLRVEVVSLDELVAAGKMPPPDFIKIDIEGAELSALKGARALLSDKRPVIFLSTHGDVPHRGCCDFLRSLNYKLTPLESEDLDTATEVLAVPL